MCTAKITVLIFPLAFFVAMHKGGAQTVRAFENAADKAFEAKDYYSALKYYEKALEISPNRFDLLLRNADAARLFGAYNLAEEAYLKITEAGDTSEQFRPAVFWLATVQKMLGKYDLAMRRFKQYSALASPDPELFATALSEIDDCEWALEQLNNPDAGIFVERLGEEPNTANSDFGAVQRGDTLFYSSYRDIDWKDKHLPPRPIVKVMEAVGEKKPVQASFNDPYRHTAHTAVSPAGDIMIFNQCDYVGENDIRCELWFSKKLGQAWAPAVKLPDFVNAPGFTATQPNIAIDPDGGYLTLFFVSDRPGGKGGLDIWKTKFTAEGVFSNPENLGALNTAKDDVTPFFENTSKSLYFSSLGLRSLGGFDIYKSQMKGMDWQAPEHLPTPFNSSFHDVYFAMQGEDWALFSSNRSGSAYVSEEACCYDIYKGTYRPLSLETLVFSKTSGDSLNEVLFTFIDHNQPQGQPTTSFSLESNRKEFPLKRDRLYTVIASKEGFRPDTVQVSTAIVPPSRKYIERLYLEPSDFALNVRTFQQQFGNKLNGVSIQLLEVRGTVKEEKNTTESSNEAKLSVKAETQYTIIGSKSGFRSDTVTVGADELKPGRTVTKDLVLTMASLSNFLPLALFFDNDQPDPGTYRTVTTTSYEQTYERYMARHEEFVREFTQGMSEAEKQRAKAKLDSFFETEVKLGYMKLDYFAQNLDMFLENNYKVEIMVKGYASPLAKPEYNMVLTKRRIASVMNYFRATRGGKYNPYLLNGQLLVSTLPFGETQTPKGVSDNPVDKRRSVFSVEASRERRTEILEIQLTRKFKD